MFPFSDDDIQSGYLISQNQFDTDKLQWLIEISPLPFWRKLYSKLNHPCLFKTISHEINLTLPF